jgi:hypothetical protein
MIKVRIRKEDSAQGRRRGNGQGARSVLDGQPVVVSDTAMQFVMVLAAA